MWDSNPRFSGYEPDEITSSLIRIGRNGIEPLLDVYKTPFLAIERTPNGAGEIRTHNLLRAKQLFSPIRTTAPKWVVVGSNHCAWGFNPLLCLLS